MRPKDDHGLPDHVEVHNVACPIVNRLKDKLCGQDNVPYFAFMLRKVSDMSLVGTSSALPRIGSRGGPGGRGRLECRRNFR